MSGNSHSSHYEIAKYSAVHFSFEVMQMKIKKISCVPNMLSRCFYIKQSITKICPTNCSFYKARFLSVYAFYMTFIIPTNISSGR